MPEPENFTMRCLLPPGVRVIVETDPVDPESKHVSFKIPENRVSDMDYVFYTLHYEAKKAWREKWLGEFSSSKEGGPS